MFEREIKFIYDFNLNKINRLGPYFTFEQLLSSDIHPAILQYISAEIDYLVFEDRQKLLKNSVFDYSGEKISYHFNQISEEVKKTKRFALEYISKLVMHASSFTVNYLIHPKWTLTKFVFDEDNHKSTNEIKQILNYVYYYKYISKILVTYINAKKILSMNAQEFETLLNKADRLGVESNLHKILTNSLKSMAEFFNIGEIKKTKIPLVAVELFLEEKELTKHLIKVTEVFGGDENGKFNITDYEKVLKSVMLEIREPEPEAIDAEEYEIEQEQESATAGKHYKEQDQESAMADKQEQDEDQEHYIDQVHEPATAGKPTTAGKHDIEQDQESAMVDKQEQDEDQEKEQKQDTKADKEIIITYPTKIRIHIDDEIHIEPILENTKSDREELNFVEQDKEEIEKDIFTLRKDESTENQRYYIDQEPATAGKPARADKQEDEEITIEGLRNTFNEDEAEIEFKKELELAQRELEKVTDEIDLPEIIKVESIEEEPATAGKQDEEESLSFMIKQYKEQEQESATADKQEKEQKQDKDQEPATAGKHYKDQEHEQEQESEQDQEQMAKKARDIERDENAAPHEMELAEILERKEMTTIIDVIFDYDIESFASLLDEISSCKNVGEAFQIINQALTVRDIDYNSNEAELFRSIISEFFGKK